MIDSQTQPIDLRDALDKHLNARSLSKSISTLLQSKRKTIDYTPYYQRKYVWEPDKATFFIESILLGIEIPPLIMFIPAQDKNKYEVIDGRQRFETLKRFFEGDFKLSQKGLRSLKGLKGLSFNNLEAEIKRVFLETTIRIIEFSTIGEHFAHEELEDRIKKEIFWRYNSGITPLKNVEVQSANHLADDFTNLLESEFEKKRPWIKHFEAVFFAKHISSNRPLTKAECQAKIRELLVLAHFPINIYASTSGRRDKIEWLYGMCIEKADDKVQILSGFIQKIELLYQFAEKLKEKEWMIYQAIYWSLVVLEQNKINIDVFFNQKTQKSLLNTIHNNIDLFTGSERGFAHITKQRFQCVADFVNQSLEDPIDFNLYLKRQLKTPKNEQPIPEIIESITQLKNTRLNRPDAVTKTIDDLIADMGRNTFLIRPAYQRQEVINIKKASGIIESMLLGIPLPTFFIYRHNDGICEVVDGQQRLLSILGFLGESYRNNNNVEEWSEKNKYGLSKGLTILKELGGKKYKELSKDLQDCILDFELSLVYIDEKYNEEFDPIDLFIRLNNKPYPVKDYSFEMWNSYAERSIIEKIKDINTSYQSWFYYRINNNRMDNEELLTVFAYLSSKARQNTDAVFETIEVYNSVPKALIFRVAKIEITKWLRLDENQNNISREEILASINDVEVFIQKTECLAKVVQQTTEKEELASSLNKLLGVKSRTRQQKPFYILWLLLLGLDKTTINKKSVAIVNEIAIFFDKNQHYPKHETLTVKDIFKKNVEAFWAKFN
jgi:uncharacterized protein with ParB-like and HNH nuclease domain